MQDSDLLRAYHDKGDEAAFSQLVGRYVNLVYSTALRHLDGDSHWAEEIAQSVFLVLARKSGLLVRHPTLAGWLYRTTCHLAERAKRSEWRRRTRELEAAQMNNSPDSTDLDRILPLLDQALNTLSEADRVAVLSRFFLGKPMAQVGLALGVNEGAAKMRVSRALERLRQFFARKGVTCSAAALAGVLAEKSVRAAPANLHPKIVGSIATANPSGAAAWTTKTLILMSQAKTVTVLIATGALLALSTTGLHYLNGPSVPSQAQRGKGTSNGPSRAQAKLNSGVSLAPGTDPLSVATAGLRAALTAPTLKNGVIWPSEDVSRAVAQFPDKRAAFEFLKEAAANPSGVGTVGGEAQQLQGSTVRDRAIRAMQALAGDVPEVVPYLWGLYKSDDISTILSAFLDLKGIGLNTSDLPALIDGLPALSRSPAGRSNVPQAIADLIAADPQGSSGAIASLGDLLSNPDPKVQLSAACALATSQLGQDPRVASLLSGALSSGNASQERVALKALTQAGPGAASFIPALLDLAQSAPQDFLRRDALRAVASIQPDLAASNPDVAQVVASDATARDLGAKLSNNTASVTDLLAALKLPQYATQAATQLGALGSTAATAVPALLQSLNGQDEVAREKIVEAIYNIDPQAQVDRVDAQTMDRAIMGADVNLGPRGTNYADPVTSLIMQRRAFSTWWTPNEVASYAQQLSALDPSIGQIFINKVIEGAPSMRSVLRPGGKLPAP